MSIVDVGGTGGGSGGSTSGIQELNGQTGPNVTINGNHGIGVTTAGNVITIDGASLSGLIFEVSGVLATSGGGDGSGLNAINGALGPNIEIDGVNGASILTNGNTLTVDVSGLSGVVPTQSGVIGVNGIDVQQVDGNFVVDGVASSGTICFSETFTDVTSTTLTHNLGSTNVLVNVFDASDNQMGADRVGIVDLNNVILQFNTPQTGKAVIVACISDVSATELLCEAKRYALLVS